MKVIRSSWFCLSILIGTFIMLSNSCTKKESLTAPILSTVPVTNIAATLASGGGNITSEGGASVTARGVCWSTTTGPTTALSTKTTDGTGAGSFTSSITALTAGTVYFVKAYATNSVGTTYGNEITFTTSTPPSTVPGAPTIGTATAGNAQATVTFTAPINNGGSAITGYTVTSSPGGIIFNGTASPITAIDLTNGTSYTFTVTAQNRIGTSLVSSASNSVTPSTVPDAPTINKATAGNAQATVTFFENNNGGSAITGYTVTSNPGGLTATGIASPITVTGLTNGTAYTFTVTATNANGTSGAKFASNSVIPLAPVIDIDGNVYNTVAIGTQTWLSENLKTTKYNDGTVIPIVTDNTAWGALATPAYCWYNNDATTYKATYGALYDGYTVDAASNGNKNVCPTGWHVPTEAELSTLTNYLISANFGYIGISTAIGKSMASTSGWTTDPNAGNVGNDQVSNNSSGFTAFPSGGRSPSGPYGSIGEYAGWWSSSKYSTTQTFYLDMQYDFNNVGLGGYYPMNGGFAVRCLKN
jgi:uncharacterized protein (TIGR02145 family)